MNNAKMLEIIETSDWVPKNKKNSDKKKL